jgi:hypothetical protein
MAKLVLVQNEVVLRFRKPRVVQTPLSLWYIVQYRDRSTFFGYNHQLLGRIRNGCDRLERSVLTFVWMDRKTTKIPQSVAHLKVKVWMLACNSDFLGDLSCEILDFLSFHCLWLVLSPKAYLNEEV